MENSDFVPPARSLKESRIRKRWDKKYKQRQRLGPPWFMALRVILYALL
jgi:hypothetical protein